MEERKGCLVFSLIIIYGFVFLFPLSLWHESTVQVWSLFNMEYLQQRIEMKIHLNSKLVHDL